MHELVYYAAMIWMTGLLCGCVALVIRTRSQLVRILAMDSLTLILIALLILYSTTQETPFYLDAAVLLALVSFATTLVAARYRSERTIF